MTYASADLSPSSADSDELAQMSDEALNLISVGAHVLMGGKSDRRWGQHTGAPVHVAEAFPEDCATCGATQWFDAAQAEMRRRARAADSRSESVSG